MAAPSPTPTSAGTVTRRERNTSGTAISHFSVTQEKPNSVRAVNSGTSTPITNPTITQIATVAATGRRRPVSYTHLTLPTTPYV